MTISSSSIESASGAVTAAVVGRRAADAAVKSRSHGELWRELAFLIVGALVAVGAEEARDVHHRGVRGEIAVAAVRRELAENVAALNAARAHHLQMATRLDSFGLRHVAPPESVYMRGLFRPAILQTSAWETAVANGTLTAISYDVQLAMAALDERANRYRSVADAIGQNTMADIARFGQEAVLRDRYQNYILIERDFAGRERSLADAYSRVIALLPHAP